MFGFGKKKSARANVISHWYTPVPNFTTSTQEFYTIVEKELAAQQVPGLEISRVEFAEAGILSAKRQYLRLTRERLTFDICAAPFGVNYFFSCRFAELPRQIKGTGICLVFFLMAMIFLGLGRWLGATSGLVLSLLFMAGWVFLMRNAATFGLIAFEAAILKSPALASIYEYLRKESYYKEDTRLMYLTIVEGVVKKLVEQETAAKGITLLQEYEYAPILGDLYKPRTKTLEAKTASPK